MKAFKNQKTRNIVNTTELSPQPQHLPRFIQGI